jgi:DNA repair exonuclease SbcCD ATPase subunit
MIIHSIHAVNVLKYARLDLENLPEKGKIAVSGANESGKTAIVETIAFALFGRTFTSDHSNITRTIRWGETNCSVEMTFTAIGNNSYTINRSVDKQGMHSAELFITGNDTPLAIGPQAVEEQIINAVGFDFEQYIDSLYLAQVEITSSASQAHTIKAIAGSTPIESISDEIRMEIRAEKDSLSAIEEEQNRLREKIESLDVPPEKLSLIEVDKKQCADQIVTYKDEASTLQTLSTGIRETGTDIQDAGHALSAAGRDISLQQWQTHLTSVDDAMTTMRDSVSALEMESELRSGGELKKYIEKLHSRLLAFEPVQQQADICRAELGALLGERGSTLDAGTVPLNKQHSRLKRRLFLQRMYRRSMQALMLALIVTTVLLGAGWWLLVETPDSNISVQLSHWLEQQTMWWNATYLVSLRNAAIASLSITVLVFFMSTRVNSRISKGRQELNQISQRLKRVREEVNLLDHINDQPLPKVMDGLRDIDSKPLKVALDSFTENNGSLFLSEKVFADHQFQLNTLLDDNASHAVGIRESIATQVGKLTSLSDEQHNKINKLELEIEDIHKRQKEKAELEKTIENSQPSMDEHRQRIQVRETALKLTVGACSDIYTQFNKVLSKYTAIVMPKLTENRYKQIQIDDSLRLRVFSTEKNDFAELDELSSGTQRQIMLALRLAISRALVEAGQQGKQFIILDEPFAFFDRERIRNTITSLNDMDKNITQFWIITQEFESPEQFELNIQCSRDSDELKVEGKKIPTQRAVVSDVV